MPILPIVYCSRVLAVTLGPRFSSPRTVIPPFAGMTILGGVERL